MSIKSSVVVPTYNGRQRILNFLDSVLQQTRMPDEVIVVVDGSNDDTINAITANVRFKELPLVVHSQENKGRPAARNAGLRLAKHELILSFDDDMVLTETVVAKHIAHHKKHPDTVCIGYQAEKKPLPNDPNFIFLDFRYHLSQRWNKQSPHYPEPLSITNYQLTTANCSFPKSIIDVVGYFDEQLKEVEDFDLGTRMMKHNYKLYYYPDIVAWHDNPGWDFAKFIQRQVQYRHDDLTWLQKVETTGVLNDELRKHPRCTVGKKYNPFKHMIINLMAQPIWVKMMEQKWITIIPKQLRYKLMDMITTSFTYKSKLPVR
jgi:GT2 family glycosyltransferase